MSVLWVLPVVVIAAGLVAVFVATKQAAQAAIDLRAGCTDLMDVRSALVALADEAGTARDEIERLGTRSVAVEEAR
jgi:cytochrome c-type biogenesis protein CcmH/NrfF